jgi:hypothetical protein
MVLTVVKEAQAGVKPTTRRDVLHGGLAAMPLSHLVARVAGGVHTFSDSGHAKWDASEWLLCSRVLLVDMDGQPSAHKRCPGR